MAELWPHIGLCPIGVYVAARPRFLVRLNNFAGARADDVLKLAFARLPLDGHGWMRTTALARQIEPDLWEITRWRV